MVEEVHADTDNEGTLSDAITHFDEALSDLEGIDLPQYATIVEKCREIQQGRIVQLKNKSTESSEHYKFVVVQLLNSLFTLVHELRSVQSTRVICGPRLQDSEVAIAENLTASFFYVLDALHGMDATFAPLHLSRGLPLRAQKLKAGATVPVVPADTKARVKRAILKPTKPGSAAVLTEWSWTEDQAASMGRWLASGESVVDHSLAIVSAGMFKKHLRRVVLTPRRLMVLTVRLGGAGRDPVEDDAVERVLPLEEVTTSGRTSHSFLLSHRGRQQTVTLPRAGLDTFLARLNSVRFKLQQARASGTGGGLTPVDLNTLYNLDVTVDSVDHPGIPATPGSVDIAVGFGVPAHPHQLLSPRRVVTLHTPTALAANQYSQVCLTVTVSGRGSGPVGTAVVNLSDHIAPLALPDTSGRGTFSAEADLTSRDVVVGRVGLAGKVELVPGVRLPDVLPVTTPHQPALWESGQFTFARNSGVIMARDRGVALLVHTAHGLVLEDGASFAPLLRAEPKAVSIYDIYSGSVLLGTLTLGGDDADADAGGSMTSGGDVVFRVTRARGEQTVVDAAGVPLVVVTTTDLRLLAPVQTTDVSVAVLVGVLVVLSG